jgi:hypothetical protein
MAGLDLRMELFCKYRIAFASGQSHPPQAPRAWPDRLRAQQELRPFYLAQRVARAEECWEIATGIATGLLTTCCYTVVRRRRPTLEKPNKTGLSGT